MMKAFALFIKKFLPRVAILNGLEYLQFDFPYLGNKYFAPYFYRFTSKQWLPYERRQAVKWFCPYAQGLQAFNNLIYVSDNDRDMYKFSIKS